MEDRGKVVVVIIAVAVMAMILVATTTSVKEEWREVSTNKTVIYVCGYRIEIDESISIEYEGIGYTGLQRPVVDVHITLRDGKLVGVRCDIN